MKAVFSSEFCSRERNEQGVCQPGLPDLFAIQVGKNEGRFGKLAQKRNLAKQGSAGVFPLGEPLLAKEVPIEFRVNNS
jgi:hypothetical protein